MLRQTEGLPLYPVWNAYEDEESKFLKKFVKCVFRKFQRIPISLQVMFYTRLGQMTMDL